MVWHTKKIAVLDTDSSDENNSAFVNEGWTVFIANKNESSKIINALRS